MLKTFVYLLVQNVLINDCGAQLVSDHVYSTRESNAVRVGWVGRSLSHDAPGTGRSC